MLFTALAHANIQVFPMVTTISGKTREERVERLSVKSLSDKVQLISVVTKKLSILQLISKKKLTIVIMIKIVH